MVIVFRCRKVTRDLGLAYEKIDACVNDCVLFRNAYATLEKCPICSAPRWKTSNDSNCYKMMEVRVGVAQKVLRYFPITPRLQRFFM